MLHPLLRLMLSRPDLLADHAGNYVELARVSARTVAEAWRSRLVGWVLAIGGTFLSLVFLGVGVMLHASAPDSSTMAWYFWAVPLAPACLATWGFWMARSRGPSTPSNAIVDQLKADLDLLKGVV